MGTQELDREKIHSAVRDTYGEVARKRDVGGEAATACCEPACCTPAANPTGPAVADSGQTLKKIAEAHRAISDYSAEELASVPPGAYLGEGSGTPVRHAGLQPGETVVDLGAGAGMDSFLAANRVGPSGRVFGFDLTPDMLQRARENAAQAGCANVTFQQADIEHLPMASGAADAAISNCVINLTPDKPAVYREIYRVLKPGGRLSVSDIVLCGAPEAVRAFRAQSGPDAWCACVSGALREEDYLAAIRAAGFADVREVSERTAQSQPGNGVSGAAITVTAKKPQ